MTEACAAAKASLADARAESAMAPDTAPSVMNV
jgi:hypothetical protein